MAFPTTKPTATRKSSDISVASHSSSKHAFGTATHSLRSILKKPFQGWTKEALWAKYDLDDVYNFPTVRRRGTEHGYTDAFSQPN
ncbi:hypothetical protein BU23DRAFT_548603, partial [Bimuria novae-zelandiae CBS 107.79]